jgi:imidazolonepropionase-like amidohydrolase
MTNLRRNIFATLALLCLAPFCAAQDSAFAVINANLFNGTENKILAGAVVFVREGKIERIADAGTPISSDYSVIDAEGNYLLPGLFDVHTHIETLEQAQRALSSGVTTVRSASTPAFQDVALRELSRKGRIAGPDVIAAGIYVTPQLAETVLADPRLSSIDGPVDSDEELRMLVQINADRGVDVIKTRGTERAGVAETDPRKQVYSEHQLRVIVEEASRHGLSVLVHAHGDEGARAAVLAGARSIEHGTYLSTETLGLMKERGTWFVPTYVTMDEMNEEQYDSVLRLRGKYMVPELEKTIRTGLAMKVKFATGADNYYDEKSINRISIEVAQFVRLGMSNFEALQAATISAAELLHLQDQTGRIAPGYEADMILVPANPLSDIEALQDVLMVVSNGRIAIKRIPFAVSN